MNFLNNVIYLIALLLSTTLSAQQNKFVYKEISSDLRDKYYTPVSIQIPKGVYNLANDINKHHKLSIREVTKIIQDCISTHDVVILPDFPVTVSKEGLLLKNNSTLIFQRNSQLIIENNDLAYYELIKIHDITNVKILNARLTGDRKNHLGQKGEWGYGISIRNASNVVIRNFYIDSFWGDGIAIGYGTTKTNKSINIENGVLDNNRRNGLSVMNVDGLKVSNLLVANTNGTNPMFGIDFEANNRLDNLNNIQLRNIFTYNNANGGLMLTFSKLKSNMPKTIGFSLSNYKDVGSPHGLMLAGVPKEATGLKGKVMLDNIILEDNLIPITGRTVHNNNVSVNINNLKVVKPKNKNMTNTEIKRVFDLKKNYSLTFQQ